MNEHERQFVETFVSREKRDRYHTLLSNPKKRPKILDSLNHAPCFDARYVKELPPGADVADVLRQHYCPEEVYVISDVRELDGRIMSLEAAISEMEYAGFGTILSCIPGRLAYYYGEQGEQRAILIKKQ